MNGKTPKNIVLQLGVNSGSDRFPIILVLFTGCPRSPYFCVFY